LPEETTQISLAIISLHEFSLQVKFSVPNRLLVITIWDILNIPQIINSHSLAQVHDTIILNK